MLHKLKLLDYFLLILLLLKGLLGKRDYSEQYEADKNYLGDIESDYFKIFHDIKDMRSKVPEFYNTDVTFEPERAFILMKDPTTSKRTSIITPWVEEESPPQHEHTPVENTISGGMDFQKREDDPLHQTHGVGEGLAALPKPPKAYKHADEEGTSSSVIRFKHSSSNDKISEEGKTKIYNTHSLGMVRESIHHNNLTATDTIHRKEIVDTGVSADDRNDLDASTKSLHISPILIQALTKLEKRKVENDSSDDIDTKVTVGIPQFRNSSETTESSESVRKSALKGDIPNTHETPSNNKNNVTTRNMIVDAGIKGFLAKIDQFTFGDVGVRKTSPMNFSFPEKQSSNLAANILSRSNITHADGNSSGSEGEMSSKKNESNAVSTSSLKSKTNDISNNTHEEPISLNLTNETSNEVNNSTLKAILETKISDDSKADNEPITDKSKADNEPITDKSKADTESITDKSKAGNETITVKSKADNEPTTGKSKADNEPIATMLEKMLGNEPEDTKPSLIKTEEKGSAKTLIQTPHHHHSYSALHLASVTDEMKDHLDASPFKEPAMGKKKDVIDALFQPECSKTKPCPPGKYCRHFECYDCHNKHHECIADEQCCSGMPCIYGRCDKKAKKSPGAICKNDGDCSDGCCVLEPTINIETGICKIKLAEFHQCSPVLYRKVWIGDKKPGCGPCEDGLECTNKGVIATHLVCMKKKK